MFKFKNADRQGADLLKKYGYVEMGQFQPNVLHDVKVGQIKGYFCANCKFHQEQEGNLYGSVCTKLKNAEIASWGCCNLWEYAPPQPKDTGEAPEADSTTEPEVGQEPTGGSAEQPDGGEAPLTLGGETMPAPDAKPSVQATGAKQPTPAKPAPAPAPAAKPVQKPVQAPAPVAKPVQKPAPVDEPVPDEEEPENIKKLREKIQAAVKKELSEILRGKKRK